MKFFIDKSCFSLILEFENHAVFLKTNSNLLGKFLLAPYNFHEKLYTKSESLCMNTSLPSSSKHGIKSNALTINHFYCIAQFSHVSPSGNFTVKLSSNGGS